MLRVVDPTNRSGIGMPSVGTVIRFQRMRVPSSLVPMAVSTCRPSGWSGSSIVIGMSNMGLGILYDIVNRREGMLAETKDVSDKTTGRQARVEGFRICGKTGTAEQEEHGIKRNTTWFISFAPYESPRYAVVVMVENGISGGATCAPVAADVYRKIKELEAAGPRPSLAQTR